LFYARADNTRNVEIEEGEVFIQKEITQ